LFGINYLQIANVALPSSVAIQIAAEQAFTGVRFPAGYFQRAHG
jgi:hypothetical protein